MNGNSNRSKFPDKSSLNISDKHVSYQSLFKEMGYFVLWWVCQKYICFMYFVKIHQPLILLQNIFSIINPYSPGGG
jgi:hypothetical protein